MLLMKGGTLLNLLVVFVSYFGYRSIQLRSDIMLNVLHDTTSLFPSSTNSLTYISFLKKKATTNVDSDKPDDDIDMDAYYASKLYDTVSKQSTFGQIEYLGKCVAVLIESTQFESTSCDFMMISSWSTKQEFNTFQSSKPMKDMWSIHNAQRYQNSSPTQTIFISIVMQGLLPLWTRLYSTITGFKYNLNIQPTLEEEAQMMLQEKRGGGSGGEIHFTPGHIQALSKEILGDEAGDAASNQDNAPIYIFNWMNSGAMTKEDQKKNDQYKWEFIRMLVTFGGGPIHYGSIIDHHASSQNNDDDDGNNGGSFAEFGAVYYPSRRFFVQLLQSKFLREVVHNKYPGKDSLAVVTTPYVRS